MPELSFATVLSVVGLGFTAIDLFMRYKNRTAEVVPTNAPEPYKEPPPSKINEKKNPQMGML